MSQANASTVFGGDSPAWVAGFGRLVRDALAHLHDPTYLQTHPLTRILDLPSSRRAPGLGRILGLRLVEAIDALRPGPDAAPGSPAWRRHQILTLRYVEALEAATIAERLAISRSQYFSDLRAAIEAVTSLLGESRATTAEGTALPRRWRKEDAPLVLVPGTGRFGRGVARLPLPLSTFIGRERELADIRRALPATRLLTLTGPGGCGKTRLALEVALQLPDEGAADVGYVELGALADPVLVPYAVAAVLGIRERPHRSTLARLLDALQGRSALLVLDNCEHLLDACARLAEAVLRGCPDVRLLATSREALAIPGEVPWLVPVLATPPPDAGLSLAELRHYDAVRLFLARVAEARPSLVLTDADAPAVAQICARLDGLPFALELAAAQARVLSLAQLAARLDDRLELLTRGSRTALPRQQTLRATIDWSYGLLTQPERALFRRLAVFAGGWTLEAAETVGGDVPSRGVVPPGALARRDVLGLLARLVDQSLVLVELPGGGPEPGVTCAPADEARYRFLESIREYAREELRAGGEEEVLGARHVHWCLTLAEAAEAGLAGPDQVRWLRRLELEHDNFRAALAWCQQTEAAEGEEIGLRLASGLAPFWTMRGHYAEGRAILENLLAATTRPEEGEAVGESAARTVVKARALVAAGQLASLQADYAAARAFLEQGLALAREVQDDRGIAAALRELGDIPASDTNVARALLDESLEHARRAGDATLAQRTLLCLAEHVNFEGDVGQSRALAEEGLALARQQGDRRGIAAALSALGWITSQQGGLTEASAMVEEALGLLRALGDQDRVAWTLLRLAVVARDQERADVERSSLERCLALARHLGDREVIGWSLHGLAWMAHDADDLARARDLFAESLSRFRALAYPGGIARALEGQGRVSRDAGDYAVARGYLEEAIEIRRTLPNRAHLAGALWSLGLAAYGQGDLVAARASLTEGLALWQELGDQRSVADGLEGFGAIAAARGLATLALRLAGAAAVRREEIGAPLSPARQARLARHLEPARRRLGIAETEATLLDGRAMGIEAVVASALERAEDS